MKNFLFPILLIASAFASAGEFYPDGFTVSTNLDWKANAVVVRDTYPAVEETVLTNFVFNGGALVVLRSKESGPIGTAPAFMNRRSDELGLLLAWPKAVTCGATIFRLNKGFVLICENVNDEKALLENVEWNLGFQRYGYVMRKNAISIKDGRISGSFMSSYPHVHPKNGDPRMLRLDLELDTEDGPTYGFARMEGWIDGNYWYWHGIGVSADNIYFHGKIKARLVLTDETADLKVKIGEALLQGPAYLDILVPKTKISVDRALAPVRIGLRINDEPHVQEDVVKVTVTGPDNKAAWTGDVDMPAVQTIRWFEVPLAKDAVPGRYRVTAETLRDIDRPHKVESAFEIVKGAKYILDQDSMAIRDGVRIFTFAKDESYTNSYTVAATFKLGNVDAMTSVFVQKLMTARRKDPSAGVFAEIELGKGTGNVAADLKTLRAVAYLAYISGANGIHWKDNTAELVTSEIERELAAFGPEGLRQTPVVVSTDGFVFARIIGKRLIAVNTERLSAHESILRSVRLSGGDFKLKLEPDEVRVIDL